tara:strand:- start:171 stop:1166 length:996 start_codon:yes stop_codon:yes gene_type:complete
MPDDDIVLTSDPRQIGLFMEEMEDCDAFESTTQPSSIIKRPKNNRKEGDLPSPDQELVVATSGGKDSAAMALWLRFESGLPNPMHFVFNNTGHEHPFTLGYLKTLGDVLGQEVEEAPAQYTFLELAIKKKRFPSSMTRFCTEHLKILPMQRWIAEQNLIDPVICQGVRAEESARRAKMPVWDNTLGDFGNFYDIWRPVLRWSVEEVFAIHKRHDLEPNPLYKMGAGRVGCWPCIHVGLGELRNAFRRDADLLDRLRHMEAEVGKASPRGIATIFRPNFVPERFHDAVDSVSGKTICTIDAVHAYLMGTDNLTLFDDDEDVPTCMSQYGLCE